MKILNAQGLKNFWYGMDQLGVCNYGMAIIGYSLPPQDEYARLAVYTIVRNYQEMLGSDEKVWGDRKSPLVIVNHCKNKTQLRQFKDRYRFVNRRRATVLTQGFGEEAVKAIFHSD